METNLTQNNDLTKTDLRFHDEYFCDKNIDRTKFFNQSINNFKFEDQNIFLLSACYHLDKSTNKKTGGIYHSKINYNENEKKYKIDKNRNFFPLDYGILEYKINEDKDMLFSANSNCTFSVLSIDKNLEESNTPFELKTNIKVDENENDNCCNYLELSKFHKEQVLLAMNNGNFYLYDLNKQKNIYEQKAHDYGLWSTLFIDENTFLTGSEDSLLKMWDVRSKNCVAVNRSHQASINCIIKDKCNFLNKESDEIGNYLITGSYDENIYFIDIRNFKDHIYKQKLNCSLWDIKQIDLGKCRKKYYDNEKIFLMSCIYEGFRIFSFDDNNYNNNSINLDLIINKENGKDGNHNSIVYGVDIHVNESYDGSFKNDILAVSSSFYDNKIILWKFN